VAHGPPRGPRWPWSANNTTSTTLEWTTKPCPGRPSAFCLSDRQAPTCWLALSYAEPSPGSIRHKTSTRGFAVYSDDGYTMLDDPRTFADEQLDREVIERCGTVTPHAEDRDCWCAMPVRLVWDAGRGWSLHAGRSRHRRLGVGDREVLHRRHGDARSGRLTHDRRVSPSVKGTHRRGATVDGQTVSRRPSAAAALAR
jgi:hypothetical protein